MKIGILTFQDTNNFGACLQALALYQKVKKNGHDAEIIDYRNDRIHRVEYQAIMPSFNPKKLLIWLLWGRRNLKKYHILQALMRRYCHFSPQMYTRQSIAKSVGRYDRFMVGSDQVWALNVTDYDYSYMLDFVQDDSKKYAFSSSISNEELFIKDRTAQDLVARFKQIAVREQEAVDAIVQTTGKDVKLVGDPTMLLTSSEWDTLIKPVEYHDNYVFIYFTDPDSKIFGDALAYAKRNNCKVWYSNLYRKRNDVESVQPKSLSEFVGLIKHCKALFTASYHGMLFGLYYHKQMLFYNRNQKSRMYSLSRLAGIAHNSGETAVYGQIPAIDYEQVGQRIAKLRSYSLDVLNDMLQ